MASQDGISVKQVKDIEHVAGEGVTVVINGNDCTLTPLTLRDYAEVRTRLRSQALRAFDAYADSVALPETDRRTQMRDLLTGAVPDEQVFGFYGTIEGVCYMIWQSLHHKHPQITFEKVETWIADPVLAKELTDKIATLSFAAASDDDGTDPTDAPIPSGNPTSPA